MEYHAQNAPFYSRKQIRQDLKVNYGLDVTFQQISEVLNDCLELSYRKA